MFSDNNTAFYEDQEKVCRVHPNYLVALSGPTTVPVQLSCASICYEPVLQSFTDILLGGCNGNDVPPSSTRMILQTISDPMSH